MSFFVALPIAVGGARDLLARFRDPPASTSLLSVEDLHLTIAFLGRVDDAAARAGFAALEWPLGPVLATFARAEPMGEQDRFSALACRLARGRVEVEAAMGRSRGRVFEASGADPERRPPHAHVTIARVRSKASPDERAAAIAWARRAPLEAVEVGLDRVALFTAFDDARDRSSDLGGRRRYRVVDERAL